MQTVRSIELPFPVPATPGYASRRNFCLFAILLLILNAVAILTGSVGCFTYLPGALVTGEWWRILTHPFVHVTWYHLLLDGAAFLALYASLANRTAFERLLFVSGGAAGSLLLSLVAWPPLGRQGLCGLSGIAHGLMAVSGMEMIRSHGGTAGRIGWISLAIVCTKSVVEALTGHVLFASFHFGMVGAPVAVCHLGGVLGGFAAYAATAPAKRE